MYYVGMLVRGRRKPQVSGISTRRLNVIDQEMQKAGVTTYDLGIMWSAYDFAWAIYAFGEPA